MEFALNFSNDEFHRSATLGPMDGGSGADYYENIAATASKTRYGTRAAEMEDSDIIYKENAALWVLMWWIQRGAFPRRVLQYEADPVYAWIPMGSIVTITDAELALDQHPAIWVASWSNNILTARLILLNNPNQDRGN